MRPAPALVDYAGDSDDDDTSERDQDEVLVDEARPLSPEPPRKKRKLAPFQGVAGPKDDPSLHQGKVRATPFVEGQYCAYVYAPVSIPSGSRLHSLVTKIVQDAKASVPTLRPIGRDANQAASDGADMELRVSLTRPIYLRAHQRDEVTRAVRALAQSSKMFSGSFAGLAELENDEKTRTFLVMEMGAGWTELKRMSNKLDETLRRLRQTGYYEQPRFHASIGWALLDGVKGDSAQATSEDVDDATAQTPNGAGVQSGSRLNGASASAAETDPHAQAGKSTVDGGPFPTIPGFPPELIKDLNARFAADLRKHGQITVDRLCVRIGTKVTSWSLGDA